MNQNKIQISLLNRFFLLYALIVLVLIVFCCQNNAQEEQLALNPDNFRHYVDYFNRHDSEDVVNFIPNAESWQWMVDNIPL